MENEVKGKNNKKKIIIISIIVVAVLILGIGGFFAVKMIREKIEYDNIVIRLEEDSVELNYGDTLNAEDYIKKYEGGEIEIENNIDFNTPGEYKVIYTVTSENGFEKSKELVVNIVDNVPPTITLDKESIDVKLNEEIDVLSGIKAEDNYDKDITDKVTTTGEVDVSKEGTYEVKYDVKDSSNNSAETKTRTYTVKKEPTLQIGKSYEWSNSQGGSTITLKKNNIVEATGWATLGGATDYKGTYKIDGDKLTITLTQMYDLFEWVSLPEKEQKPETYTITDDNQFEDSDGRVYKMK